MRKGFTEGAPLVLGAVPFGIATGVAFVESIVPAWTGWLGSWLMFAGAAQLAAMALVDVGAPTFSAFSAGLIVNARLLMYSAAMVPGFRGQPRWFRLLGPYMLTDQLFALSSANRDEAKSWRVYYLTIGISGVLIWHTAVAVGILFGGFIPSGLPVAFIIPVMFLALLVPSLIRRPAVVGALVAALVSGLASGVPNRGGLFIGAVVGVIVSTWVDRRSA